MFLSSPFYNSFVEKKIIKQNLLERVPVMEPGLMNYISLTLHGVPLKPRTGF